MKERSADLDRMKSSEVPMLEVPAGRCLFFRQFSGQYTRIVVENGREARAIAS